MKVGDLIYHKWGKDCGIVVGRPDPGKPALAGDWYVLFNNGRKMVHETSCEVLSESR